MFGLFSPRCPIDPRERVWVERGLGRLIDVLGREWFRRTPVLTADALRDVLEVEPIVAGGLAQRLAPQFPVPVTGIHWLEEPDIAGQMAAGYVPGDPPIGVVPHQPSQTPEQRTALVARCLCEHALATAGEFQALNMPPGAVDLLSVLCGLGVFGANGALADQPKLVGGVDSWFQRRSPFIPARQFGYALAVRCLLCDESDAAWVAQLRPDAREPFELGQKFLRRQRPVCWDESRDALRSFGAPLSAEVIVRHLRHREPARQIDALCEVNEFQLADAAILSEIGHLVHDRSSAVREETIRSIVLLDRDSGELGDALIILCDDSAPRVRSLAALALGEVSHPPDDAVATLRTLTGDAEPNVSSAAAESLLGFPEGLADDRPRLFRVLRQQLARCNYESVDRFMRRLSASAADAALVIEQEFAATEDETWRRLLLESVDGAAGPNAS